MAELAEIEKTPMGDTSVNSPASGTYGEKADVENLKKSLPSSGPGSPPPGAAPMPGSSPGAVPGQPGRPGAAPPGVPTAVMGPSNRPNVPLGGVPGAPVGPPLGGANTPSQARLALLQGLAQSPDVSDETREWAKEILEMLLG